MSDKIWSWGGKRKAAKQPAGRRKSGLLGSGRRRLEGASFSILYLEQIMSPGLENPRSGLLVGTNLSGQVLARAGKLLRRIDEEEDVSRGNRQGQRRGLKYPTSDWLVGKAEGRERARRVTSHKRDLPD